MRGQQRQRRRRHALDAAGLSHRAGAYAGEAAADFVGKAGQGGKIEIGGDRQDLVASEGGDVGCLPVEIDRVFGVDLDLRGGGGRDAGEGRPDRPQPIEADIRKPQDFEARPPHAVAVDGQPVPRRGVRAQRLRPQGRDRDFIGRLLLREGFRPLASDQAEAQPSPRQALVGVVGAQRQAIFGARGEHAVGLADPRV